MIIFWQTTLKMCQINPTFYIPSLGWLLKIIFATNAKCLDRLKMFCVNYILTRRKTKGKCFWWRKKWGESNYKYNACDSLVN